MLFLIIKSECVITQDTDLLSYSCSAPPAYASLCVNHIIEPHHSTLQHVSRLLDAV